MLPSIPDLPHPENRAPRARMQAAPFDPVSFGLRAVGLCAIGLGTVYVGWTNDEWLGLLCGLIGGGCFLLPMFLLREHQEDVARVAEANEKLESHTTATGLFLQHRLDRAQELLLAERARDRLVIEDMRAERDAAVAVAEPFVKSRKNRAPDGRFIAASKFKKLESQGSGAPVPVIALPAPTSDPQAQGW